MIITSTNEKRLSSNEISFDTRETIDSKTNKIRCSGKPVILEKYQLHVLLGNHSDTFIRMSFEGEMKAGSSWGITNIHLLIGCTHFIIPDA